MPPKKQIEKNAILEKAFELTRINGFDALTARALSASLNCSTQPIYQAFTDMKALEAEVAKYAARFMLETIRKNLNLEQPPALAFAIEYVRFALQERHLLIVIARNGLFQSSELMNDTQTPDFDEKLIVFINGIVFLSAYQSLKMPWEQIQSLIVEAFYDFQKQPPYEKERMSMKHQIQKERLQLMSPSANVCAYATISARTDIQALRNAIQNAVRRHFILRCKTVVESDGSAYLLDEQIERPLSFETFSGDAEQFILKQEHVMFATDEGETIRFFYQNADDQTRLIAVAHHIICDGNSLILLMGDILRSLNGQTVEDRPIRLLTHRDLEAHPKLNPFLRLMIRSTNAKWAKSGKTFDYSEYRHMFASFVKDHRSLLKIRTIAPDQLDRLIRVCHDRHITLNSLIAAAFLQTLPTGEDIGIAADVRPEGCVGMGNYAIAVGIKAKYNSKLSMLENAESLHRVINRKLKNPKDKYFLYDFMGALSPTLTDSIYFTLYDGYRNPVSESLCKMCGYTASPKGFTLSNLKTLSIPDAPDWTYHYTSLRFIPPYVPNVRGVIGISTFQNELTLALRAADNERAAAETQRFLAACDALNRI